jgi:RHS repeat-associated protein
LAVGPGHFLAWHKHSELVALLLDSLWHGLLTVPPGRPKVSVLLDRAALVPAVFGCLAMLSSVTYGSGDSDSLTCDNNTGRMTQYKFNVGSQSMTGALTWNQNGTLQQLAITDPFNSADQQTCNYTYDDLARINTVNCGSGFSQSFGIGALGNITKTGTLSFSPTYNGYTNQITSVGGQSYTYDADGDLTSTGTGTGTNAYTWDAFGKMTSDTPSGGSSIGIDYDALGRAAMTNVNGSSYTEFVYAPDGSKLALMNGQTLYKARVPLTGGGIAIYDPTGLVRYWHSDWQGTMRLVSNPSSPTYYWSGAYAPYGETYALGSNPFVTDFASLMGDTSGELNDATFREYNPTEGRWMSPDPAGLAAVDLTNPQSLNRYAYVMNNPTTLTDPLGLYHVDDNGNILGDSNGEVLCDDSGTCYTWSSDSGSSGGPSTDPAFGADQGSGGWSWGGLGNALGSFGRGVSSTLTATKNKVCSALPQGRTVGVSGGIGGVGGQTGSLELVINYNSGQISGFASFGLQVGWNGGAQGSAFTGFLYGQLNSNNSGYAGGFSTISGSVGPFGGFHSSSSGGWTQGAQGLVPNGNVTATGASIGASLIPPFTATGSATIYSRPLSLGKYWALGNPVDGGLFLARQVCK